MKNILLIVSTFLILISTQLVAQNKNVPQPELDSGTIEQQFDYIITKSTKFKEFQLIRKTSILKVKTHTLDSIKTLQTKLNTANSSTTQLGSTISQLENEVSELKTEIESISVNIESISFFGTPLSKTTYNTIVWSIIVILILFLIIFIARLKSNTSSTKSSKNELEKIETEFEAFRKNALKKEQEIMRKLQDQINKNNP